MKLSNLTAKLTCGKAKVLTMFGGLALAGAVLTAAAPAAQAQQFGFGVQFGGPRYVAPPPVYRDYGYAYAPRYDGYNAPGYWEHRRIEQWRAHEDWEHRREFSGRPAPFRGNAY